VLFAKRPWPSGNQPRFLLTSWFIDLKILNHEARAAGPPMTLGNMRELGVLMSRIQSNLRMEPAPFGSLR
jgi:hypothetical protein